MIAGNMNKGAVGRNISLCIERNPERDPIIDILVINPQRNEKCPLDYIQVSHIHTTNIYCIQELFCSFQSCTRCAWSLLSRGLSRRLTSP